MVSRWRQGACALGAFLILAVLQTWPLPLHLSSHLTGPPTGDTGVYVWNTWVFRHELVERGRSPFTTSSIFSLDSQADLSLHNYTLVADLIAVPLQPLFGVVATFNLIYLLNVALAGFGMYLLARRLTGRAAEAWVAGALFACMPFLVARSTAHFSLVAAAPLPFFMYLLDRAWHTQRVRDAAGLGASLAWAAFSDPYYAVYCLMLGGCFVASQVVLLTDSPATVPRKRHLRTLVDAAIVALACLIVGVHVLGGGSVRVASLSISMRTLYTPVLVLTVLVVARLLYACRVHVAWRPPPINASMVRAAVAAVVVAAILLAPTLYAVSRRMAEGRLVSAPVHWRSSAPGVDLLAIVTPNPNHPLAPERLTAWLASRPGGFVDQVAALSFVALGVLILAWRRAGFRASRLWLGMTAGFLFISLGPFVTVGGLNTYIPTPWAILRYAPVIGAARMPSRFAILAALGFCVLFAGALVALTHRYPHRRRAILAIVATGLVIELVPAPRTLYSAEIPAIYRTIAEDPRPIRVLELPYGIRDGLSSLGNFSAASQFHQTLHEKPLVGGYLSRVSQQRKGRHRRLPVRNALIILSEGRPLTPDQQRRAREAAPAFLALGRLGYVVVDTSRASLELRAFAIDLFRLTKIGEDRGYELYVPSNSKR